MYHEKGLTIAAFDAFSMVSVAGLVFLLLAEPAYAYVDPSVMTYTIQALAGVAVALSTVAGVVFRRSRRKLFAVLGIDENRNKEVEDRVHRIAADGTLLDAGADTRTSFSRSGRHGASGKGGGSRGTTSPGHGKEGFYSPKVLQRVIISLLISVFVVGTLLIVAPFEIIAGNSGSILLGVDRVWTFFVPVSLAFVAFLTLVLSLLRGRAFNAASLLLFGFGLACYIQALFLNGGLPSADGQTVSWPEYRLTMLWTLAVWIAVFLVPWLLSRFNIRLAQMMAAFLSVAFVIMQGVGVASLLSKPTSADLDGNAAQTTEPSPRMEEAPNYVVSETGILDMTPSNNVVVFVLDSFDTELDLMPMLDAEPTLAGSLTGFTWFKNSAPSTTPTREAMPALITGAVPTPANDLPWTEIYANSPYVADLESMGYRIGLYSDAYSGKELNLFEHTVNGISLNPQPAGEDGPDQTSEQQSELSSVIEVDGAGTVKIMLKCALYRDLPWVFKPYFWYYTDDINNAMIVRPNSGESDAGDWDDPAVRQEVAVDPVPYVIDDAGFYGRLKSERLSIVDDGSAGSFHLIHLLGPHFPNTLDEHGEEVGNTTRAQQARGSMQIVLDYIQQMKDLGIYDNSTIIITADHGYRSESNFRLMNDQLVMSPVMLVKPMQTAEEAAAPMQVSENPVETLDIMPTVMSNIPGSDASRYPSDMFHITDPDRVRYFYFTVKDDDLNEIGLMEIKIQGDALDFDDWTPTGFVCDYRDGYTWKNIGDTQEYRDEWLARLYKTR